MIVNNVTYERLNPDQITGRYSSGNIQTHSDINIGSRYRRAGELNNVRTHSDTIRTLTVYTEKGIVTLTGDELGRIIDTYR